MKQTEFLNTVLPFKDKVFRLAKRLLVSKDEAEDATQELYFKLWKNKDKLSEYKNVEIRIEAKDGSIKVIVPRNPNIETRIINIKR